MPSMYENEDLNGKIKTSANFWSVTKIISLGSIIILTGALIWVYFKLDDMEKNRQSNNQVFGATTVNSSNSNQNKPEATKPAPVKPTSAESSTVFFGDVIWTRYLNQWSEASNLKEAYPFSGLSTLQPENYDVWIANLECPVTSTRRTAAQEDAALKFSCDPKYLPEAAKFFKIFSLANNHTDNMQEVNGLKQTRQYLDEQKLEYFGHFDSAVRQDICEVVTIPVRIMQDDKQLSSEQIKQIKLVDGKASMPVALCGYNNVFKLPTTADLTVIKQFSEYFPTFVMPHQGLEYKLLPDKYQQSYHRQMIDQGADGVLGGHTHTVMPVENYKGKLIAYSMGNFIFDQQFSRDTTTGLGLNLEFNFKYNDNLEKWLILGPECVKFKDECLQKAKDQKLTKPDFSLKFNAIVSDSSNKLTKKADESLTKATLQRIKWEEVKTSLENTAAKQ
ncbi:MAG: hypothetical protein OHK0017_05160 [Patescibacteria group bacterium]